MSYPERIQCALTFMDISCNEMSLIESWQLLLKSSDGHSVVVDAMLSYLVIWYYIFNLQTTITDFIIVKALRYYSAD